MSSEKKVKMSSSLMAMKFMRQGEALEQEQQVKKKQQELEDTSKWTLKGLPSVPLKKKMARKLQAVNYNDIYNNDILSQDTQPTSGRREFGDFVKV